MREVVIGHGVVQSTDALKESTKHGFGLGWPGIVLKNDGQQVLLRLTGEGEIFGAEEREVKMRRGFGNLRKLFLHYLF